MNIAALAIALASGAAKSKIDHAKKSAKYSAIAGGCFAVSVIFIVIALTMLLADHVGGIYACLIVGGIFFTAGLIAMLLLRSSRRRKVPIVTPQTVMASTALAKPVKTVGALSLAALAGGFLLSRLK